jgi:WD40 repeat protein
MQAGFAVVAAARQGIAGRCAAWRFASRGVCRRDVASFVQTDCDFTVKLRQSQLACCTLSGNRVASGDGAGTITVLDVKGSAAVEVATLQWEGNGIAQLASVPGLPDLLVAAHGSGDIAVWSIAQRRRQGLITPHNMIALGEVLPLPGAKLALSGYEGKIVVWDLATCTEDRWLEHPAGCGSIAMTLLPNGLLATSGCFGTAGLWDWRAGVLVQDVPCGVEHIGAMCGLTDGRVLCGGSLATEPALVELTPLPSVDGASVSYVPRGYGRLPHPAHAIVQLAGGEVAISVAETAAISVAVPGDLSAPWASIEIPGASGPPSSICALADGRLATACADGTLRVMNCAPAPPLR